MRRTVQTPIDNLTREVGKAELRRHSSSLIVLFLTLLMLHLFSSGVRAQTTTSTIEGTVKDPRGAVVAGAQIKASSASSATERTSTSDENGFYRITALPAGTYTLTASGAGFANSTVRSVELTVNRTLTFDVQLEVGKVQEQVSVTAEAQLIDSTSSAPGTTVTPRQITEYPVNGRNYLDLLQLVPGVAINRQSTGDNANPVLGERSGNNNFFIDGQPNKDTVNGGAAAQFNQETIAEFQVLTTGFKAEFGQASGAVVNVLTKSGGKDYHGVGSLFHRNNGFDGNNSLDPAKTKAPFLHRFDYSLALGGPVIKDKVFFFGSSERITENRKIDFKFPDTGSTTGGLLVQQLLRKQELPFDTPALNRETRSFFKLNEQLGRHQLTQEINYTQLAVKNFLPLSSSASLPSARNDSGARHLLLAFGDTVLLGPQSNPWVVTLRGAYRGEPSDSRPAHPEAGGGTLFVPFTTNVCCTLVPGDLPTASFGNSNTASRLNQKYTAVGANAAKLFGRHDVKFGWNFLRTKVDGVESQTLTNQLYTTVDDFIAFGAVNSGINILLNVGAPTAAGNEIHLRNNYNGLFVQDDWKLRHNLTLNLGLRWDYDSEFVTKRDFSPRLGAAWAVTPKTIVRGHFGVFYDQFRLGLARDVPSFGGADQRLSQIVLFPRGLYGSPSFVSSIAFLSGLPGACFSNRFTDAQITAGGLKCGFPGLGTLPMIGVDRLNNVVAAGHAPIPANAVINLSNVQALTGLSPDQYAAQASAAIGQPAGYFVFGPFGVLNNAVLPPRLNPTSIDGSFKVPHTLSYSIGVQREIGKDMALEADYYHRDIRDLLGVRKSNLAFQSRVVGRTFLPPFTQGEIETYGPFYKGKYDGLLLNLNKRLSRHFLLGANYTYAQATDNSLGIGTNPSDNFIGIVPVVSSTEAGVLMSNANGPYTRANGRFVAQAGTFLNGPDLDKGPSSLAVDHIFQVNGLVEFPWQIQVSGIFRVQSGFHFSRSTNAGVVNDPDGDGNTNTIDHGPGAGRNAFTAPPFVNLDMRLAKQFAVGERVKVQVLFEFFNLFNRQNPAAVSPRTDIALQPFGQATQVLPGREGQVGFRISF